MPIVSYVDPKTGQTKEKKFSYDPEGQHAAKTFATEVQGRIVDVSRRDPKSASY